MSFCCILQFVISPSVLFADNNNEATKSRTSEDIAQSSKFSAYSPEHYQHSPTDYYQNIGSPKCRWQTYQIKKKSDLQMFKNHGHYCTFYYSVWELIITWGWLKLHLHSLPFVLLFLLEVLFKKCNCRIYILYVSWKVADHLAHVVEFVLFAGTMDRLHWLWHIWSIRVGGSMSRGTLLASNNGFEWNASTNRNPMELIEQWGDMCLFGLVENQMRHSVLDHL